MCSAGSQVAGAIWRWVLARGALPCRLPVPNWGVQAPGTEGRGSGAECTRLVARPWSRLSGGWGSVLRRRDVLKEQKPKLSENFEIEPRPLFCS